jgi:Fic-DOC domain mobile mystery protein B
VTDGAIFDEPPGATPLDPDERQGLIPTWIATRADLDQAELSAIARARPWAEGEARRLGPAAVLRSEFLFALHARMFSDVWRWAGQVRRRQTNLGVAPGQIRVAVRQALDDASTWHDHGVYTVDGRAVRLHHRLVSVHPFTNGNGRTTRLFADLYLLACGGAAFSWASGAILSAPSDTRAEYLAALRAADLGDIEPLEAFARR